MSTTAPNPTMAVATRFVELCRAGEFTKAIHELYADDARHVEAMESPDVGFTRITEGKPKILEMDEWFMKTTEVHGVTVGDPYPNEDQFIVEMGMDCTHREGAMAGQRIDMKEMCLYTVRDGKIMEGRFFYSM